MRRRCGSGTRAPLALSIFEGGATRKIMLGADLAARETPQAIVPAHAWQTAESLGDWTLVSCVVAPGFDLAGFTLAPPGWAP
jgi:predicted cupin superfamily sugar epimerase